ncbi:MAG: hypothetical protein GY716_00855 [bacterium]|nr:hypothetical protein [bacterium]
MNIHRNLVTTLIAFLLVLAGLPSAAEEDPAQVRLPLDVYTELVRQGDLALERPVPAGFALGSADVEAIVADVEPLSAQVNVRLTIDVLERDAWVLVPVLPPGTPIESVTVDGKPAQLVAGANGLAWVTNSTGTHAMVIRYKIDAQRSEGGYMLTLPVPEASALNLVASLPGAGLDVSVIPSAGLQTQPQAESTRVSATIPTTRGVQLFWQGERWEGHSIGRADYSGELVGDAVLWKGRLAVELFSDRAILLPILPGSVTLSELAVDGEPATILVEGNRFATRIAGRGAHEVEVEFQVPVSRGDGPPSVDLHVPRIPVSRFELRLPGQKELSVRPRANVDSTSDENETVARVHVPMTERVTFTWSEAVPDEVAEEVRANATVYHAAHVDENVLYVHALVHYDVRRGETSVIELQLPPEVQINRIGDDSGIVSDWRELPAPKGGPRTVNVFLDRELQGELLFEVLYDRSMPSEAEASLGVPMVRTPAAQRRRGMVALLSSPELTLDPVEDADATRVGENRLPPFVRERIELTVAHTYKYTDHPPALLVASKVPERVQGRFDTRVDSLVSLGDVALEGSTSVQINVKSGSITDLVLSLPDGINLLNLTAPSLRGYDVTDETPTRQVEIEFTQEMQGRFRVDLSYERILVEGESPVGVPTIAVLGSEVEQGRIAVEALSAAEIQPAVEKQLTALDVDELPRQLVLQTTNPILLAYKYVRSEAPPELALRVTRHRVLGVQEAAIDSATYRTLFTADGLQVTTAHFLVRNSRKQFLRVRLPENSEVWSAFVDGTPENPAAAGSEGEDERSVLIKIINSAEPFPVELVYATRGTRVGLMGAIEGILPRPDILVTETHWDVYLPDRVSYSGPRTNLESASEGVRVAAQTMEQQFAGLGKSSDVDQVTKSLRVIVPASGMHFAFTKIYANQADQDSWLSLRYVSSGGTATARAMSVLGAALFWLGAGIWLQTRRRVPAAAFGVAGLGIVALALRLHPIGVGPLLVTSLVALVVLAAVRMRAAHAPLDAGHSA